MASGRENTNGAAQNLMGRDDLRYDSSHRGESSAHTATGDRRSVLGMIVSSGCRRLSAALVTAMGRGLECRIEQSSHLTQPLPCDVTRLYRDLLNRREVRPGARARLATGLAKAQTELAARLLDDDRRTGDRVLAIGVVDPGLWDLSSGRPSYNSLCDAALLAESTGHCVIEGFAARDVACGGLGGPLLAVGLWMLLRDPNQPRVLLDLGRTTRATLLPSGGSDSVGRVMALDVGPGTSLLDHLASKLTDGKYSFDAGGHMAVQGRQIPELAEHWLGDPYFQRPTPRWHPLGCRHEQELNETVRMAIEAGWSIRDLLCTACHFIAETVALAINERLVQRSPVQEILLSGLGQHNGMLLRGIASRLPEVKLRRVSSVGLGSVGDATTGARSLGLDEEALEPMAVALCALLHIDQVPANHTALTGTDTARVLGRLTPGSPENWQRLLRMMADCRLPTLSLHRAV